MVSKGEARCPGLRLSVEASGSVTEVEAWRPSLRNLESELEELGVKLEALTL